MMSVRRLASVAALFAFVGLAGCTVIDRPPPPACPEVLVPRDSSVMTEFLPGPGRDLTDIVLRAEFQGFAGSCGYDVDSQTLNMLVSPDLLVERGPAGRDQIAVQVDYYVALVSPLGRVLQKQTFSAGAALAPSVVRGVFRDEEVELNYQMADIFEAPELTIYLGFQLNDEQLRFNRDQGGL
jgi:hypothetical protein